MTRPPKILLVDDDEDLLKILQLYLKSPDYDILTATDGGSALQMIQEKKPDIVLLDLMMPGIDGLKVCSQIKGDPRIKNIKVIILTQADTPRNRQMAEALGADNFLPKPADRFELIKSIEVCLGRL